MVMAYYLAQTVLWSVEQPYRGGGLLVLGAANVSEAIRGYYTKSPSFCFQSSLQLRCIRPGLGSSGPRTQSVSPAFRLFFMAVCRPLEVPF